MRTRFPFASLGLATFLLVAAAAGGAAADDPRPETVGYFAVWSYAENAPDEPLGPEALSSRTLGYWEIVFDAEGNTKRGIYHGERGQPWLRFEYEEQDGRVVARLYDSRGNLLRTKSTTLTDRRPR